MANNYLNRYAWLIDVIKRYRYITYAEISCQWENSALNDRHEVLPERTFHNHRKAIKEIFGINILFNKSKGYYLDTADVCSEEMTNWLLTSMSINTAIKESKDLKDRIIFADVPSGKIHLTDFINAMKGSDILRVRYKKFESDTPKEYDLSPYCLKVFKQRWYLVANDEQEQLLKIFALDRVQEVNPTGKKFKFPADFSPEEYFNNYYGIVHDETIKPQTLKIKVWGSQRDYFKTLPLHKTMEETEIHEEYSIFTCWIAPTWDLEMELLQYNDWVEVIEPVSVRENMIKRAKNILKAYRESSERSSNYPMV